MKKRIMFHWKSNFYEQKYVTEMNEQEISRDSLRNLIRIRSIITIFKFVNSKRGPHYGIFAGRTMQRVRVRFYMGFTQGIASKGEYGSA